MRRVLTNLLLIGMALGLLVTFTLIAVSGRVYLQEPNTAILVGEITLLVGIISLAIVNFVKGD